MAWHACFIWRPWRSKEVKGSDYRACYLVILLFICWGSAVWPRPNTFAHVYCLFSNM
ncbi:uncharacterized protein BDW70DRAFT_122336 [Aspergillus foveolatus]|uniref:uncharacterized protein n=1 Tax=Aspergillus foveolatus TaxID=210207 RepID=UPI003CCCE0D7